MKIAKYVLLLILLLAFALFVFIFTQSNSFFVSQNQTINSSKEQVFDFTNDLSTWNSWWIPFDEADNISVDSTLISYNSNIINKTNSFIADSIQLTINDEGFNGNSTIVFKSLEAKKTEITWTISGEVSQKMKFLSFFKGGVQRILQEKIKVSLANIEKELQNRFENYTITVNGFTTVKELQYIAIQDSASISEFDSKRRLNFKKIGLFITKNNLTTNGEPFVLFKSINTKSYKYLSCIPITSNLDSIVMDTLLIKGKIDPYLTIKSNLKGNYSYRKKAWDETRKAISKSFYKENLQANYMEVYKKESKQNPSSNLTEIYIPIKKPVVLKETTKDSSKVVKKDSI